MSIRASRRALGMACLAAAVGAFCPAAEACSVCGCGDPLVSAGDSLPMAGHLRLALEGEYLTASARSEDDPGATESLIQSTLRPVVVYSPRDDLNLVLQVPVVAKDWTLSGGAAGPAEARPAGLGDVDVGGRWFFLQRSELALDRRWSLGLTGGASLPTGPNDVQVNGQRVDDHAQLGTGGFGPYAGVLAVARQSNWGIVASLSGRAHSTNAYGYRYGSALLWSVEAQFQPLLRLALLAGLEGRYAARDTQGGQLQENTGGFVLAAAPGLAFRLTEVLWLQARAQLPIAEHLLGVQTVGPVAAVTLRYTML